MTWAEESKISDRPVPPHIIRFFPRALVASRFSETVSYPGIECLMLKNGRF